MLYRITAKFEGQEMLIGEYATNRATALDIADEVLETIAYGEVLIDRKASQFQDWEWWMTLARDKNWKEKYGC